MSILEQLVGTADDARDALDDLTLSDGYVASMKIELTMSDFAGNKHGLL